MGHGRLRAYQVMLRLAKVREVHASLALAEASSEELVRRTRCTEVAAARDTVAAASRADASDRSSIDIARYELLSDMDATLAQRLQVASHELSLAEKLSQECASASVIARRYREKMDGRVKEAVAAIEDKRSADRQEEDVELWLKGKTP